MQRKARPLVSMWGMHGRSLAGRPCETWGHPLKNKIQAFVNKREGKNSFCNFAFLSAGYRFVLRNGEESPDSKGQRTGEEPATFVRESATENNRPLRVRVKM